MNKRVFEYVKYNKEVSLKILAILILLTISIYILFDKGIDEPTEIVIEEENVTKETITVREYIYVDISGAVANPGVFKLTLGTRVYEAINKAGGLIENADTSQMNMSLILQDEQKIYVPNKEEVVKALDTSTSYKSNLYININSANQSQLEELVGVGPSTAEKIIRYREENGQYKNLEDIMKVSGIGEKTFAKFKDKICI